jgi:hypothetical protein
MPMRKSKIKMEQELRKDITKEGRNWEETEEELFWQDRARWRGLVAR